MIGETAKLMTVLRGDHWLIVNGGIKYEKIRVCPFYTLLFKRLINPFY